MVRYNRKEHQILIGALFVCDKICTINTNKQVRKKSRKEGETTLDKKHKWIESSKAVLFLAMTATFLWGSAVPCIKIGYRFFGIESGDTGAQMLFAGYRFLFSRQKNLYSEWDRVEKIIPLRFCSDILTVLFLLYRNGTCHWCQRFDYECKQYIVMCTCGTFLL